MRKILKKTNNNYHSSRFVMSAPNIHHLPPDQGMEVAFSGPSNAGKSSALNTLTQQKKLAKISKIPGRTQLINLFEVSEGIRLVDLPGYGYASVPLEIKIKWQKALNEYLNKRDCLRGLVILMDIRHPLNNLDQQMIAWAINKRIPIYLLLTKVDKLSKSASKIQLNMVKEAILPFMGDIEVDVFSSLKKIGIDKLQNKLNAWFSGSINE
ncbi:ribosome biogenesis GTP-binding protein YihA/YsxC [Candidatus Williamhamiltonella defendens]|uniref:ribosome biogenesis GTP-binding protein YihA/YsxC n=1 Tax=Candidatus Williamhamiltonella defendens TaxID=138072 RepID=UPI00387ECAF8